MKNRKNYLKARKKQFKMAQIGWFINEQCPECEEKAMILVYKHDALACMACNEWKDKACDDPKCPFCSTRPQTPYEVYWNYAAGVNSSLEKNSGDVLIININKMVREGMRISTNGKKNECLVNPLIDE